VTRFGMLEKSKSDEGCSDRLMIETVGTSAIGKPRVRVTKAVRSPDDRDLRKVAHLRVEIDGDEGCSIA
jgi:hypothetical protein